MTRTFGPFVLEPAEFRLSRDGQPVPLSPRPFDLLVALTARPGQLVTRDELLREVWQGAAVETSSLNAAMSVLRQALGDAAGLIETVPGRGYRFRMPVPEAAPAPPAADETGAGRRVVIVDDHAIVRMGVRALVERRGHAVAGEAASPAEASRVIAEVQPDLLVLDLMLDGASSLAHIAAWRAAAPGMRVIVLSMHDEAAHARDALTAGAHGYVMKSGMLDELTEALDAVTAGEFWVSPALGRAIAKDVFATRPISG
ncbi:MAG: response regulator [Vicinamibacterales bacterium]